VHCSSHYVFAGGPALLLISKAGGYVYRYMLLLSVTYKLRAKPHTSSVSLVISTVTATSMLALDGSIGVLC
jgi:hypothetical protein